MIANIRQILGLNGLGKIVQKSWLGIVNTNGIAYIIKDELGNIYWEPNGTDNISPFPRDFHPIIGETILISEKKNCYYGTYQEMYLIKNSFTISSSNRAIRILIVNQLKL